jgi:hypothetical protein
MKCPGVVAGVLAGVVAGVVALMLDANEGLGWRDVKEILANSASLTGSIIGGSATYETTGTRFQVIDQFGKITRNEVPINKKRVTLADRDLAKTRSMTVATSGCAHAWTRDVFDFFVGFRIKHFQCFGLINRYKNTLPFSVVSDAIRRGACINGS